MKHINNDIIRTSELMNNESINQSRHLISTAVNTTRMHKNTDNICLLKEE